VHDIVQQAGGVLRLTSQLGEGTEFTLFFERVGNTEAQADQPPPPVLRLPTRQGIVVVEDDQAVREYIVRILQRQGFRVAAFASAREAQALLQTDRASWHGVLCDLVLPGMTAREFFQKLQGSGIDIPFLSMSGYTDEEIQRLGVRPEVWEFLHKPFQSRELVEAIHRLVESS